jgi:hypothetical protein
MAPHKVHIFWDNSNIYVGAKDAHSVNVMARGGLRISFENIYKLALANRPLGSAHAVGSVPPEDRDVWKAFAAKTGIQPELFERGSLSRTEQAVDQALQVHILRALADEDEPQIAVLLTGDGKGFDTGTGFHSDLSRMHKKGWGIEVLSWSHTCAKALREFAESSGCFVQLDDFIDSITYVQGVSHSIPLNLRKRRTAKPRDEKKGA